MVNKAARRGLGSGKRWVMRLVGGGCDTIASGDIAREGAGEWRAGEDGAVC
jgi:hypothetical protein